MEPLPEQDDLKARLAKVRRAGEERAAQQLAAKLGYPYADLSKMPVSLDAVRIIPETEARDGKIAGIEVRDRQTGGGGPESRTARDEKALADLAAKKYIVKIFVVSASVWHRHSRSISS